VLGDHNSQLSTKRKFQDNTNHDYTIDMTYTSYQYVPMVLINTHTYIHIHTAEGVLIVL